uniref:7TM_GPCR_Srx domain-containing protein n=1 Tax=Steinernema glaseri TaxID=37863 RepID=A0A1I7ZR29_9BILA
MASHMKIMLIVIYANLGAGLLLLKEKNTFLVMDLYLFNHDKFEYFYNCSMYSTEQWNSFGVRRTGLGLFSIVAGVITIIFYVPCAKTMLLPELWKLPCYRLMFLNSIIDIWGIINSCFLSGYLSITGAVFCSHRDFLYVYGSIVMGLWAAQCMTAFILALNRCIEFWQNPVLTGLFEGYKIAFWWLVVIAYFFTFFMFTAACPYTSVVNMWMIDPYVGIPGVNVDRSWVF